MHRYELKTERLLLRPLTVADADAVWEWAGDERVARYMVYPTYTDKEAVREWLRRVEAADGVYEFGFQRLCDGLLIGSGSIGPDEKPGFWCFGYNLRHDCWGMGYATEAAKAMIAFAHDAFGATRFRASHVEPNRASGHVMEKCGLHFAGYGAFAKLDGSCPGRSMEYEGILYKEEGQRMKIMAIDYGDAHTGVAISDPTGTLAGFTTVINNRRESVVLEELLGLIAAHGITELVVGYPKNMDGTLGPRAEKCAAFAGELGRASSLPVTLWDERRSTVEAHNILFNNGKNAKKRKTIVDAVAASLMLEGYLTRKRLEGQV